VLDSTTWEIRVYVVDDHPIVCEGFATALADAPDIVVVGQADTAAEALKGAPFASPDVLLVDLNMPDRDGIELVGALHARMPEVKLLVLSAYDDEFRVAEALRAGAYGYLVKTSKVSEVIEGIRRSAGGRANLSPHIGGCAVRVGAAVVRAMPKPSGQGSGALDALTTRERQVLRLLVMGVSTSEAAALLTISPKTVETHRVRIFAKLGCKSVAELSRIWRPHGPDDDPPAAAMALPVPKRPPPRPPTAAEAELPEPCAPEGPAVTTLEWRVSTARSRPPSGEA